jgi:SAM-dependent methyltransferase
MQGNYEQWWRGLDGSPGEVFWDADPVDSEIIKAGFDPSVPVVDLGCGDGRQTRLLATHFRTVIGTDMAPSAIQRARQADNPPNVTYRVLDARDRGQAEHLHGELGDVNIYIRGVLHALADHERPVAVASIHALLGTTGTLFLKELSPDIRPYFDDLMAEHGPPPGFARIQQLIPPGVVSRDDLAAMFVPDRFEVLQIGDGHVHTVHTTPTGEVIRIPALYALIRPTTCPARPLSSPHTRRALIEPPTSAGT